MEETRFDAMVKVLGSPASRRLTFGALLGGALSALPLVDPDEAAARCKPRCRECEKCQKKKHGKKKGTCKPKPAGAPCAAFPGGVCQSGTCVNVQTDEANCGALGTVCGPTQVCQAGSCFPRGTCPATPVAVCPLVFATFCGDPICVCDQSTEGNVVCVTFPQCPPPDGPGTPCTTSATCPPGSACVDISGCGCGANTRVCAPQCPTPNA